MNIVTYKNKLKKQERKKRKRKKKYIYIYIYYLEFLKKLVYVPVMPFTTQSDTFSINFENVSYTILSMVTIVPLIF